MDLKQMQKLIKNTSTSRADFQNRFHQSLRYYNNENDITNRNDGKSQLKKDGKDEPLRSADNRVSSNFHQLLVDQEAGYLATVPPTIDVGSNSDNQKILDVLGDTFGLTLKNLVIDGANAGRGWLHYWIDEDNNFRYAVVPPDQITPIYSTTLNTKIIGLLRSYKQLDEDSGKYFTVHEYWNDKQAVFYRTQITDPTELEPFNIINSYDMTAGYETGQSNVLNHDFGRIPFIEFDKNRYKRPDLFKYKGLIDAYDDIYNGFLNDLDDVQQVVLVLTNYGGTSLAEFRNALKRDRAIKINSLGDGDKSGVDKLTIDIPVDARDRALQITRDNLFLQGQGVDPSKFDSTNASGVAIKMLYSHLELKASITETQFRSPLNELIRAVMKFLNMSNPEGRKITQTWTRTKVEDDVSKAQVVAQMANYSSKEAVAKANPIVTDWVQELKDQKKDAEQADPYANDDFDKPEKKKSDDVEDDEE